MSKKPFIRDEILEIKYKSERWEILRKLRQRARGLINALTKYQIRSIVYGSIARGDVSDKSDIDIFIPEMISSFRIETALINSNFNLERRILTQATPRYSINGYIEIGNNSTITFPLSKLRITEREFYKFSGEASQKMLKEGIRIHGVDKRLMLIIPTKEGHIEKTIIGNEPMVSKTLKISLDTVNNRIRALTRRDKFGRTGLYIKKELQQDETFESMLKQLSDKKPAVRRRLRVE